MTAILLGRGAQSFWSTPTTRALRAHLADGWTVLATQRKATR